MRVRVKEGHSRAGAVGTVLKQECASEDGVVILTDSWFVHLDGEAAPRWIRRDALEPEEVKVAAICFPKVRDRVAIGEGKWAGMLGSVVQVDREDGTVLVQFDQWAAPLWFHLEDILQGDIVAAIERELQAQADLKAPRPIKKCAPGDRVIVNHRGLWVGTVESATDREVMVDLDGEGRERFHPGDIRAVFGWAPPPPPAASKPKNERLRGMIYTQHRKVGARLRAVLLMQAGYDLIPAQYDEVVRRSNAWGALERLHQRMRDELLPDRDPLVEELGRIVKGGV